MGQSEVMSESGFYWCVRHNRVETGDNVCPARYTMGPYASREIAEGALRRIAERNEKLDAEDAAWEGK
jgi:hypothetical protein